MENTLNINSSVLTKFVKMRGVVRKNVARAVDVKNGMTSRNLGSKFLGTYRRPSPREPRPSNATDTVTREIRRTCTTTWRTFRVYSNGLFWR
jgi:hypothetical protein